MREVCMGYGGSRGATLGYGYHGQIQDVPGSPDPGTNTTEGLPSAGSPTSLRGRPSSIREEAVAKAGSSDTDVV